MLAKNDCRNARAVSLILVDKCQLGEAMFSCKVRHIVEGNLRVQIEKKLNGLIDAAVLANTVCGQLQADQWREKLLVHCKESVESLQTLPSKRSISVPYRGIEVAGVQVSCLADHMDMFVCARIKAAAVAAEMLPALEAESLLGCVDRPDGKKIKVGRTYTAKAIELLNQK